jgi:hypothetical protein
MLCPGANPGRRGGKPATNRLSYGTAKDNIKIYFIEIFDECVYGIELVQNIIQ